MALITFMSDFGEEDHYIAAVKASILKNYAQAQIIDISHKIQTSDIGHAAYLLRSVFRDFESGSIHLCALDRFERVSKEPSKAIAIKLEGHYFVGPDSGLFSLISDQLPTEMVELESKNFIFPAKDCFGPVAGKLLAGTPLASLGRAINEITVLFDRKLKATKREIVGNVIRVDSFGNLITNIVKSEFDTIRKINNNVPFEVVFGRENSTIIHTGYHEVESGDCFVLFNSTGNLEIGINKGSATELLGLKLDAQIFIHFKL